jgi:hypothetical protein
MSRVSRSGVSPTSAASAPFDFECLERTIGLRGTGGEHRHLACGRRVRQPLVLAPLFELRASG